MNLNFTWLFIIIAIVAIVIIIRLIGFLIEFIVTFWEEKIYLPINYRKLWEKITPIKNKYPNAFEYYAKINGFNSTYNKGTITFGVIESLKECTNKQQNSWEREEKIAKDYPYALEIFVSVNKKKSLDWVHEFSINNWDKTEIIAKNYPNALKYFTNNNETNIFIWIINYSVNDWGKAEKIINDYPYALEYYESINKPIPFNWIINKTINDWEKEERKREQDKEIRKNFFNRHHCISGLYHMTHISNLENILKYGLLSHILAHENNYIQTNIANTNVNEIRSHKEPIYNKPIHSYVPLYFNPINPMLYAKQDIQDDIVILEFSPLVLLEDGVIFTDGNAAVLTTTTYKSATKFYSNLDDLDKIDLPFILYQKGWNNYEDGKRKKCAEVLVPDRLDLSLLKKIGVNTLSYKEYALNILSQFRDKYNIEVDFSGFFL